MKKIIPLLIVLSFCSCRYFNVSPANGITIKNLTERPLPKDFIGAWKIDIYSYDLLMEKGYEYKKVELRLGNNGSFEAENFPNFIDVFSDDKTKRYINAKGSWKIAKDFEGTKWVLQLNFENEDLNKDNYLMEFDLYLEREKIILWYFVGDPDLGERLLFKKE